MHFFKAFAVFIIACITTSHSLSLLDALKQNVNASIFAHIIEGNPSIAALYLSSNTRTVFAPSDEALKAAGIHANSSLQARTNNHAGDAAQFAIQAASNLSYTDSMRRTPGVTIQTLDQNSTSDGSPISIVAKDDQSKKKRGPSSYENRTSMPLKIYSGLGNTVKIIEEDIPYECGVIQTTDGFFTLPETLSETISKTGYTEFGCLVSKTNLTNTLDATPAVTAFIPTNNALQSYLGNTTQGSNDLRRLVSNHVITGFVGYSPLLQDGASFKINAGTNLTVTIKNGIYFINGVQILASDLITENGVAHVVSQVIVPRTPAAPPPIKFSSVAWSFGPTKVVLALWNAAMIFGLTF